MGGRTMIRRSKGQPEVARAVSLRFVSARTTMTCMWRLAVLLVTLLTGLMASGLPFYLHGLQHDHEDAVALALARPAIPDNPKPNPQPPIHTDDNCPIHAAFHAPALAPSVTTCLIDTGLWIRYVSMLAISQHAQTVPDCISCRGPPQPLLPLA